MDTSILLGLINVLMGVVMWFMKTTLNEIKEQVKENRRDIDVVKDNYLKRADFIDFKEELFNRLDRDHNDILRQIARRV